MGNRSAFGNRLQKRTEQIEQQFPATELASGERRQKLYAELASIVGRTRLEFIPIAKGGIFLKRETDNPSETHYDRVFPHLIQSLESRGKIIPGVTKQLIETSSGSVGPSFGWVGKALGYQTTVIVPQGLPPGRINAQRETVGELIISSYPDYLEGMIRTLQEMTSREDIKEKLLSKETVVLNHSRRKEAPQAFEAIAEEVIEQLPPDVHVDTFVCAIGNGTTITGIGKVLRERFGNLILHGYEERQGGLYGATGAQCVEMPFVRRETFQRITVVEKKKYEQAIEDYNRRKIEMETLGGTSVVGLHLAREMIENHEATFALVLGYDNLGRYDTVVEKQNSIYMGNGHWSSEK